MTFNTSQLYLTADLIIQLSFFYSIIIQAEAGSFKSRAKCKYQGINALLRFHFLAFWHFLAFFRITRLCIELLMCIYCV